MHKSTTTLQAVEYGLLKIAPPGSTFPGRNGSPGSAFLIDVRGAVSNVSLRDLIVSGLITCCESCFGKPDLIAGISKAGVPWAAMVAMALNCPAAVVHLDGPRKSGLQRQVEGDIAGKQCVVIDNVLRSGESVRKAVEIIEANGGRVIGALTIAREGLIPSLPVPAESLWTTDELLAAACGTGQGHGRTFSTTTQ